MIQNPNLIIIVLLTITMAGFWLSRFPWLNRISPALLIMLLGAIFVNTGILPDSSNVYNLVSGPLTSLAIVFLVFSFRLNDLKNVGWDLMLLFIIAIVGSAFGGVAGGLLFADSLPEGWKLAGALTATYSGGSLNFAAIGRELQIEQSLFIATTAADNITTALWLGVNLMLPLWLAPWFRQSNSEPYLPNSKADTIINGGQDQSFVVSDAIVLLILAMMVLSGAVYLHERFSFLPRILWLTTLALALAQLPWVQKLQGSFALGNIGLHLFFAVIGVGSQIAEVVKVGPTVFYFTLLVVAIHGLVIYSLAWLVRLPLEKASIASQAAIGGPSTAMAVAMSRWPHLMAPAMIIGLLGYAAGNYAGFAVAAVVRALWY